MEEEVYHLRTENSKEVTVSSQMHEQKIYELESRIVLLTQDIESTNSKLRAEAQSSRLERDER